MCIHIFVRKRNRHLLHFSERLMVFVSKYPALKQNSNVPLHERILEACRQHAAANKDAIIFIDAETTTKKRKFSDIEPAVNSLATALMKLGLKPGDIVSQVLPNCPEFLINMLAVQKCGAAMSNASPIFTDYELQNQFHDSKSVLVFTDEDRLSRVRRAITHVPTIQKIICLRTFPMKTDFPENVLDFGELVKTPAEPINLTYDMDSLAMVPYSSGTTGRPKGCRISHRNMVTMMDISVDHLNNEIAKAVFGKEEKNWRKEHTLLMLPWYHAFGMNVMLESIILGMTGLVFKKFDTITMLNRIKFFKVKLIYMVPPMLIFLAKDMMVPIFRVEPFVKVILSAGATAGKQLIEEVLKRFPHAWICQAYGMSEMVQFTTFPRFEDGHCFEQVGALGPTFEMKIINAAGAEVTKPNIIGELCFRGPAVMKGYLNGREAHIIDKDGFLHSGDLGSVDEKGCVHLTGRIKELIKVNGMQVPPVEIEDVLLLHPKVKDCAVIGVADEQCGESPKAFIVKKDHTLTESELTAWVQSKLSSYKWITAGYEFVDSIPKLPSGKILRRKLSTSEHQKEPKQDSDVTSESIRS
ncbi:unnamed protein product [Caenorhabditis angaria]|uniref:Uncharacterized protein n=1 Tax=Caenorhabditis angaria TaxID=860376 RepID=A0A9P1IYM9_9PELO|nr:unnamed protein product [Caenorhabditis angaria]